MGIAITTKGGPPDGGAVLLPCLKTRVSEPLILMIKEKSCDKVILRIRTYAFAVAALFLSLMLFGVRSVNAETRYPYYDGPNSNTMNVSSLSSAGFNLVNLGTPNTAKYGNGIFPTKDSVSTLEYTGDVAYITQNGSKDEIVFTPKPGDSGKPVIKTTNAGFYVDNNEFKKFDIKVTFSWPKWKGYGPTIRYSVDKSAHTVDFWFLTLPYTATIELYESGSNFKTPVKIDATLFFGDLDGLQRFGFKPLGSAKFKYYALPNSQVWAQKKSSTMWAFLGYFLSATGDASWQDFAIAIRADDLQKFQMSVVSNHDHTGVYYNAPNTLNGRPPIDHLTKRNETDWESKLLSYISVMQTISERAKALKQEYKASGQTSKLIGYHLNNEALPNNYKWRKQLDDTGLKAHQLIQIEGYWFGSTKPTIFKQQFMTSAKEKIPNNTLKASDKKYHYTLQVLMPPNRSAYKANSFVIQDTLPGQVTLDTSSVRVFNRLDGDKNVTSWFTNNSNKNILSLLSNSTFNNNANNQFGLFEIEFDVTLDKSYIYSKKANSEGYFVWSNQANVQVLYPDDVYNEATNKVTVRYPYVGSNLIITKKDEVSGKVLKGATFTVYPFSDASGTYKTTGGVRLTDNGDGTYTYGAKASQKKFYPSKDNINGKFKVVETGTVTNHKAASPQTFTVSSTGGQIKLTAIEPSNPVKITLDKRDSENTSGAALSGGTFYVLPAKADGSYAYSGKVAMTWNNTTKLYEASVTPNTTNKGKFRVIEETPPTGYTFDSRYTMINDTTANKKYAKIKDVAVNTASTTASAYTVNLKAYNPEKPPMGQIKINKTDSETGAKITQGVVFKIYDWSSVNGAYNTKAYDTMYYDPNDTTFSTSDPGCWVSHMLYRFDKAGNNSPGRMRNDGKFKVVEETQAEGYVKPTWSKEIVVQDLANSENQVVTGNLKKYTVNNDPNSFVIRKTDAEGNPLSGVKFEFGKNRNSVTEYTTNTAGEIIIKKLVAGTYVFRETYAPEGYRLDGTWKSIKALSNGTIQGVDGVSVTTPEAGVYVHVVENSHSQELAITKLDSETGHASTDDMFAQGAKFTVYEYDSSANNYKTDAYMTITYNASTKRFVNSTTGSAPMLTWSNANQGKFRVKETTPPDGYVLDSTPQDVTITKIPVAGESPIALSFTDSPNEVILQKVNVSGAPLQGAKFKIWKNGKESEIIERTTEADGKITLSRLSPGTWNYTESEAPAGYALNDDVQQFVVSSDGKIEGSASKTFECVNYHEKRIFIKKKDSATGEEFAEDSDFPAGTEFYVYEWDEDAGAYSDQPSNRIIYKKD